MITRNGVEILSKYLAGHTSSYASHIAIGCGARPYYTNVSSVNYNASSNSNPDFKGYTGTVSAFSGTGPWTVTVNNLPDNEKINIGDILLYWESAATTPGKISSTLTVTSGLRNIVVFDKPSTSSVRLTVTGGSVTPTLGNVVKMYFAPTGYAGTINSVSGTGPWTVTAALTSGSLESLPLGGNISRFTQNVTPGVGQMWNGNPTSVVITEILSSTFKYVVTNGSAPTTGSFTNMVVDNSTGPGPYYDYVSIVAKPELQSFNHIMPGDYINLDGDAPNRKVTKFVNKLSVIVSGSTSLFVDNVLDNSGIMPINTPINNFTKNELDFEMDRFKVNSISYVSNYNPLSITSASIEQLSNLVTFTFEDHGLKIGDKFSVKGIKNLSGNIDLNVASESDYYYVNSVLSVDSVTAKMNQVSTTTHTYDGDSLEIVSTTSANVYSSEISLLAELPGINKYEITEIGLYSQGSDAYNSGSESRTILDFSQPEKWQYFDANPSVEKFSDLLYYPSIGDVSNNMTTSVKSFYCNAEDSFFTDVTYTDRKARFERPRFGNDAIVVAGDMSDFQTVNGKKVPTDASNFIETNISANFSKNAATDKLKLAMSIINKPYTVTTNPEAYYVMVQFLTSSGNDFANFLFEDTDEYYVLSGNRYVVLSATLGDATKTGGFSWNDVSSVRVYASVEDKTDTTGATLSDFAIILDGLRFENVNNTNPQYGLIGYTPVTSDSIIKKSNTSNIIEFRFDLGVGI